VRRLNRLPATVRTEKPRRQEGIETMTTAVVDIGPRIEARSDFENMLLDLDERVSAIELSWEYATRLGREEWLALKDLAGRNEIPLRIA
jgi:hypothetical protein